MILEDREILLDEILTKEREEARSLVAVLGALSGKEQEGWRVAVETSIEFAPKLFACPEEMEEKEMATYCKGFFKPTIKSRRVFHQISLKLTPTFKIWFFVKKKLMSY